MPQTDYGEYHLHELAIATGEVSAFRLMPTFTGREERVLDVGCGAGQTLIASALPATTLAVGADVDEGALALGRELTTAVRFVCSAGEALPFRRGAFDAVISRVALPYMHVPTALAEMRRVLRPGGRLWIVAHAPAMIRRQLLGHVHQRALKGIIFQLYVLATGVAFHFTGRPLPTPRRRRESYQTARGMRIALRRAGFSDVEVRRERFTFVVTASASEE